MTYFKMLYFKIRRYSFVDLIRKTTYLGIVRVQMIPMFIRKVQFYYFTKCWPRHIGSGISFSNVCNEMTIGKDSSFYSNTRFEIGESARLSIGSNFTASYGCVIVCNSKVSVGDHVMIGEYTSVRDTSHSYGDRNKPFTKQGDYSEPIVIGNNVWIGRGCVLLPGTTIHDNVIIGANSVVKGTVDSNCIYAGAPLRKIKALA